MGWADKKITDWRAMREELEGSFRETALKQRERLGHGPTLEEINADAYQRACEYCRISIRRMNLGETV